LACFAYLKSIVTNSAILKETKVYSEELVNELAQASSCLSEVLNNTLDISKLDEGKVELNKSFESIREVSNIAINISHPVAEKRGVKLEYEYDEKLPQILEFDKARVTQIIMNLVGNAIKFTPKNGHVKLKVFWLNSDQEKALANHSTKLDNELTLSKQNSKRSRSISPSDIIPDENTPTNNDSLHSNSFTDLKIYRKMKNYSFVTKMPPKHTYSLLPEHTENSITNLKSAKNTVIGIRRNSISYTNYEHSDNSRLTILGSGATLKLQKSMKSLRTYGELSEQNFKSEKEARPSQRRSFITRAVNLLKLGKNFRMTLKSFPVVTNKPRTTSPQRERGCSRMSIGSDSPNQTITSKDTVQGTLHLEISDTGCGMSNDEKEKLFQPFSQTSSKVFEKYGGTGLGLWLCHKLLQVMGGKISCDSIEGKGTTFKVTIPAKSKVGAEYSPTSLQIYKEFKDYIVLCYSKSKVEVTQILEKPGCKIRLFDEFEQLVETLKENRNKHIKRQVVITGLKGAKLLKEFTKQEPLGLKQSQIIVITSIFFIISNS